MLARGLLRVNGALHNGRHVNNRIITRTIVRSPLEQAIDSHPETPIFLTEPKTVSVIGAPMFFGQPHHGTDLGPNALRETGLHSTLERLGWGCVDNGDIPLDEESLLAGDAKIHYENAHNCFLVGRANERIADSVHAAASQGHFTLTLGGDHSIAIGTTAGLLRQYPDLGVLWVDAHADINTPDISGSGNMHGMPLGLLMKLMGEDVYLPGLEWLKDIPKLEPRQVAYIGLRDVDDGERKVLHAMKAKGMFVSTMHTVDAEGIGFVVQRAMDTLAGRPLHLSYDIDALDPIIAPSTGTVVRGGLTYREGNYVAEALAATNRLVGMDIVEVNPTLINDHNLTAQMGLVLVASALGSRIL